MNLQMKHTKFVWTILHLIKRYKVAKKRLTEMEEFWGDFTHLSTTKFMYNFSFFLDCHDYLVPKRALQHPEKVNIVCESCLRLPAFYANEETV